MAVFIAYNLAVDLADNKAVLLLMRRLFMLKIRLSLVYTTVYTAVIISDKRRSVIEL